MFKQVFYVYLLKLAYSSRLEVVRMGKQLTISEQSFLVALVEQHFIYKVEVNDTTWRQIYDRCEEDFGLELSRRNVSGRWIHSFSDKGSVYHFRYEEDALMFRMKI